MHADYEGIPSLIIYELTTKFNSIGYLDIILISKIKINESCTQIKYSKEWKKLVVILERGMPVDNHLRLYLFQYDQKK